MTLEKGGGQRHKMRVTYGTLLGAQTAHRRASGDHDASAGLSAPAGIEKLPRADSALGIDALDVRKVQPGADEKRGRAGLTVGRLDPQVRLDPRVRLGLPVVLAGVGLWLSFALEVRRARLVLRVKGRIVDGARGRRARRRLTRGRRCAVGGRRGV